MARAAKTMYGSRTQEVMVHYARIDPNRDSIIVIVTEENYQCEIIGYI